MTNDVRVQAALRAPYARVFRVDDEGGFYCSVLEMPGIAAGGEDLASANEALEEQMAIWVEHVLDQGHPLPVPIEEREYSGRLTLRITPTLHQRVQARAMLEDVSLNRLLELAIAEYVGDRPAPRRPRLARVSDEGGTYEAGEEARRSRKRRDG